ncbi:MAG: restriction endonuclease subunit S [Thermomicrobiales bacterium]
MSEWHSKTIGDLVLLQRGIDLPEVERKRGRVPIMGSFGITGWHNEAACKGPGVTVGRSGASAGVVTYVAENYWPLNTCLYVRDFKGNHPRFAYYLLKTFDLARLNSGSAQPSLNRNFVHPVPARFPDPPEQEAVASILGALDDKIDLNRCMNETLDAMARALFKNWFVDFGPTRAKIEARAPYLAPELWGLFPDRFDDEEKPKGWRHYRLEEIVTHSKETLSPSDFPTEVFEHYSLPAFDAGKSPALDLGSTIKSNKTVVPRNSVLLSKLNPEISRVWLPDQKENRTQVTSTEFLAFEPKGLAGRSFVYCVLTNPVFQLMLEGMVTGTSRSHQRVSPPALLSSEVVTAEPRLIAAIEHLVAPLLGQQLANRSQSRTLAKLRDLLLPKLMSGEIRVKDAEKIAAAA